MRLSCISAYFIIAVRRIRAAAIAVQKNGNSRKIIRLSSSAITTIPYHTYLKDCCWTPLHQIFLHTPCTKVKVVLEQKNIWMRKGLNALAQLWISYYPCREMGLIDASTKVSRKSSYGLTYFSWYYCHNTAPKAINI